MDTLNFPTKRNLLLARDRLALARKGYDLLDKKRQVLLMELGTARHQLKKAQLQLQAELGTAYNKLSIAQAEMGSWRMEKLSQHGNMNACTSILFRSVMGVELPHCCCEDTNASLYYKLHDTTASLDEAVLAWKSVLKHIISWAGIENTIRQLNLHIKKTQKRANALDNITIPLYMARIKYIEEQLAERERDELARLKLVKGKGSTSP